MVRNRGFGIFIISALIILMAIIGTGIDDNYVGNYFIDCASIIIVINLLYMHANINRFDIFEPIYFISIIYGFMYFVTPIYDILVGEYQWYGYSLFPFGIKASIFALLGYISFYIFYTKVTIEKKNKYEKIELYYEDIPSRSLILIILIMYVVCFIANAYYMIKFYGISLSYILSLGLYGTNVETVGADSIGFISMLSYSFPTTVLLYWEYGNSKFLKIILFAPMLMMQITRGFRFFVIQIAVTFFAYYYIRKEKRPKIVSIIWVVFALVAVVLVMTIFRESIRWGAGINGSIIDWELIKDSFEEAFWDNFRIYQNYYGMVGAIPSRYPYVWGRQIVLGTLVMMIPRVIWPGKISSYGGVGLKVLIGKSIASGQAYPNLGEYYYSFGILGICFYMALYGIWAKRTRDKGIERRKGALNNVEFSVLLGINLQLLIRGYFPSNFWYIVFSLLPIWIVDKLGFTKKIVRKRE